LYPMIEKFQPCQFSLSCRTLKQIPIPLIVLLLGGCASFQSDFAPLSGTEIRENEDDELDVITYVSPEEYREMTPEERRRKNVSTGVKGSWEFGGEF